MIIPYTLFLIKRSRSQLLISSYSSRTGLDFNDYRKRKKWTPHCKTGWNPSQKNFMWRIWKKTCFPISKVFGIKCEYIGKSLYLKPLINLSFSNLFSFYNQLAFIFEFRLLYINSGSVFSTPLAHLPKRFIAHFLYFSPSSLVPCLLWVLKTVSRLCFRYAEDKGSPFLKYFILQKYVFFCFHILITQSEFPATMSYETYSWPNPNAIL